MLAGIDVGAYSVSAILPAKGLSGRTSRVALAASEMESVPTRNAERCHPMKTVTYNCVPKQIWNMSDEPRFRGVRCPSG